MSLLSFIFAAWMLLSIITCLILGQAFKFSARRDIATRTPSYVTRAVSAESEINHFKTV